MLDPTLLSRAKAWRKRARVGASTIQGRVEAREAIGSETLAAAAISVSFGRVRRSQGESLGLWKNFSMTAPRKRTLFRLTG